MRKWIVLLLIAGSAYAAARTAQQINEAAVAAYRRGDYAGYSREMEELLALRPGHPTVLFNSAGGLALNGRGDEAIARLQRLAAMRLAFDLADTDFDSIRNRDEFKAIEASMRENAAAKSRAPRVAYRFPQSDLITESIVYDRKSGSWLVSSVRKRKIMRLANGRLTDFATKDLWGVNGLGIDAKRRLLYATSSAYDRAEGFDAKNDGEVALFVYDVDSGKRVRRIEPPTESKHFFDDLTVAPDGTVYVSDSTGMMFRVRPGGAELEPFVRRGVMRSPQGSAFANGLLYVADYGGGIYAVDTRTGDAVRLQLPDDFPAAGIDGLEFVGGALIAVQNGVNPNRVVKLQLDGLRVTKWEPLEIGNIGEPTIGAVRGSSFYVLGSKEAVLYELPLAKKVTAPVANEGR